MNPIDSRRTAGGPRSRRTRPFPAWTGLLLAWLMAWTAQVSARPAPIPPVPGTQAFCGGNQPGPSFSPEVFPELPGSLKCLPVPQPYQVDANGNPTPANVLTPPTSDPSFAATTTLPDIVKNKTALIALGKALFWDQQVGSDGMACASCHFNAGADNRVKNQLNPGGRNASGEKAANGAAIGDIFNPTYSASTALAALPGQYFGPNYTLGKADFPFARYTELAAPGQPPQMHRNDPRPLLEDGVTPNPNYGQSLLTYETDDISSSSGVYHSVFGGLSSDGTKENCVNKFPISGVGVPLFNVRGIAVRKVEPRNAPTVINAVFNFRNFWDGRANNVFNGIDPFGARRPFPMPWTDKSQAPPTEINTWDGKKFVPAAVRIFNASLASQAVGPALSDFEMSCAGKSFPTLGRKLLKAKPLLGQLTSLSDSVLGRYRSVAGDKGLNVATYTDMVKAAFVNKWWNAPANKLLGVQPNTANSGYTQMENNFSLFWGLAVAAYEATLVSDDAKFDQVQEGRATFTDSEIRGLSLFISGNRGACASCHAGPEFTAASVNHVQGGPGLGRYTQRMLMGEGQVALYDTGFYNIGVRPSKEDVGLGGLDGYGHPLSFARNAKATGNANGSNISPLAPDPFNTNTQDFDPQQPNLDAIDPNERDAVDGAFKTPTLRNIELTGPYFHNGGYATLEQTVQFYNRGGERKDLFQKNPDGSPALYFDYWVFATLPVPDPVTGLADSTGLVAKDALTGAVVAGYPSNLAPDIAGAKNPLLEQQGVPLSENLGLSESDVADLVAFMKTLTDERVRWEMAPFDHPALTIPNGHPGNELSVQARADNPSMAQETKLSLPSVGKAGRSPTTGPIRAFEENLK